MIGRLLGAALGKVLPDGGKIVEYFDKKQALEQELKLAKLKGAITLEAEKEKNAAVWAQKNIDNSGWKDEYVLVILSVPLVGVFVPGLDEYMLRGFTVLGQTPEWYRWLIVSVMAAIYGIKPAWEFWKKS